LSPLSSGEILALSESSTTTQTIALAGVLQAACLVDQLARTGQVAPESCNPLIQSLFQFDAETTAAVYGGVHNIDLGLRSLQDILSTNNSAPYRSATRYALGMLHLQKKLSADPEMLNILHSRLQHAAFKADHFTNDINEVCHSVAAIYQDTVSTFKFRVQVSGSMQQLQNSVVADKIRALLLAGIRSAVLWRQLGGKRWHLFTKRRVIASEAQYLREH
jgi:high frequency lysogenization protein